MTKMQPDKDKRRRKGYGPDGASKLAFAAIIAAMVAIATVSAVA